MQIPGNRVTDMNFCIVRMPIVGKCHFLRRQPITFIDGVWSRSNIEHDILAMHPNRLGSTGEAAGSAEQVGEGVSGEPVGSCSHHDLTRQLRARELQITALLRKQYVMTLDDIVLAAVFLQGPVAIGSNLLGEYVAISGKRQSRLQ